jgi:hypothetical protein
LVNEISIHFYKFDLILENLKLFKKGAPTSWGLREKLNEEQLKKNDKYKNQISDNTEYQDRYQLHSQDAYSNNYSKFIRGNSNGNGGGISKDLSTSCYELNKSLNSDSNSRTKGTTQSRDVMESIYSSMFKKSTKAPRTFYYLGKIPTNGLLDIYSMKDFETLTPLKQPDQII